MVRKSLLGEVWTTSSSLSHSPHALSIWGKSSWGPYLCSVVHCYYPTSLFWIVTTRMCCPNCSEHVLEQNGYKYLQNVSDQSQSIYFSKNFSPLPSPPLASTWKFPLLLTQNPVWIADNGTMIFLIWYGNFWGSTRFFLPTHPQQKIPYETLSNCKLMTGCKFAAD